MAYPITGPSLFCPRRCKPEDGDDSTVTSTALCEVKPILAVATSGGTVSFHNAEDDDDDEVEPMESPISAGASYVVELAWRPSSACLVAGREDGHISYWSIQLDDLPHLCSGDFFGGENSITCIFSNDNVHRHGITVLMWNPTGYRFISGDAGGMCCVWQADDGRRSPLPLAKYQRPSPLTAVAFSCMDSAISDQFNDQEAATFFFGTESGTVGIADDIGKCSIVQELSSCIDHMIYNDGKQTMVVVTRGLEMIQLQVTLGDRSISSVRKAKLSIPGDRSSKIIQAITWTTTGIIAAATGESNIRLWDVNNGAHSVIPLGSSEIATSEQVISVAFNSETQRIAAGTKQGQIVMWKLSGPFAEGSALVRKAENWKRCPILPEKLLGGIVSMVWSPNSGILAAQTDNTAVFMKEGPIHHDCKEGIAAIQLSNNEVSVTRNIGGASLLLTTENGIAGVTVDSRHVVIWNRREIQTYTIGDKGIELYSDFPSEAPLVALYQDSLFIAYGSQLLVTDLNGVQRISMRFSDEEGGPIHLNIASHFLAVATDRGAIKLMDVSKKDPVLIKAFVDPTSSKAIESICSIRCNANGSMVSFISKALSESPCLYLYSIHQDVLEKTEIIDGYFPLSHIWDPAEPKLLTCELQPRSSGDNIDAKIVTLFVGEDGKAHIHESLSIEGYSTLLMGIDFPFLYFLQCRDPDETRGETVCSVSMTSRIMRDFCGLENESPATLSALVDFYYYLTTSDMDKAYLSVRMIENPSVWVNLAKVCVKRKRLDVAELCLQRMGDARGVAAVRSAKQEPESEVALAAVAIQLGLLDDAAGLYRECNRVDLLNKLLQGQGKWDESISVAANEDQVHLKNTHFRFAQYLENIGDVEAAKVHFERSGLQPTSFLRMLIKTDRIKDLEKYIMQRKDPELFTFYGKYCESSGDFIRAKKHYLMAGDDLSLVRLACHEGNIDAAFQNVEESGNKAAAYHLARYLEGVEDYQNAVTLYAQTGLYNHAIRLSRTHGLTAELMGFAQKSPAPQMIACARYFEHMGDLDKAVRLYVKGGDTSKALDLCLRPTESKDSDLGYLFISLIDTLGEDAPKNIIDRCTHHLIQMGNHEKAIQLLQRRGEQFDQVITLCLEHDIKITDEMADTLGEQVGGEQKLETLKALAGACVKQGSYQLASKKFTQAGDRLSAMKCLLRVGNTRTIIAYANASKKKEVYIVAANYIQSLDWYGDTTLSRAIINFYSKAKCFEKLSRFFESWLQTEVHERQDYAKALVALKEAIKYAGKDRNNQECAELQRNLQRQYHSIESFIQARNFSCSDPHRMEQMCCDMLESDDNNIAVPRGHVHAFLTDHYAKEDNFQAAYAQIQKMIDQNVQPQQFLEHEMIQHIYNSVGKKWRDSSLLSDGSDDIDDLTDDDI